MVTLACNPSTAEAEILVAPLFHVLVREPVSKNKVDISKADLWPPHACTYPHTYTSLRVIL